MNSLPCGSGEVGGVKISGEKPTEHIHLLHTETSIKHCEPYLEHKKKEEKKKLGVVWGN